MNKEAFEAEIRRQDEEMHAKFRDLLRRDWAVRVLDAWARAGGRELFGQRQYTVDGGFCALETFDRIFRTRRGRWVSVGSYEGANEDAARHAAALAVFPTLPAEKQAELGECP